MEICVCARKSFEVASLQLLKCGLRVCRTQAGLYFCTCESLNVWLVVFLKTFAYVSAATVEGSVACSKPEHSDLKSKRGVSCSTIEEMMDRSRKVLDAVKS